MKKCGRLQLFLLLVTTLLVAPPLAAQSGFIAGTVTSEGGTALAGMIVAAYNSAGDAPRTGVTDTFGKYVLSVPGATYRVLAYDDAGSWATSFYNDAGSFETSALITVSPNEYRSGINLRLRIGFPIRGTVRSSSGTPLSNMTVSAYNLDGTRRGHQKTGTDGTYAMTVPAGEYKLVAWDDERAYAPKFYDSVNSFASASTVSASASSSPINFSLDHGAKVSGTVIAEETGQQLAGIEVSAYDAVNGERIAFATTGTTGGFGLGVPKGRYKFGAADPNGKYVPEFFSNAPSFGSGTSFDLDAGAANVNFALALRTDPPALTTQFIPAVINAAGGDGSYWRTDVWIYNPSQESVTIDAAYLTVNGAGSAASITVSQRGQIEISDIVSTLFGSSGLGALRMTAPGPFVAVSRTFNTPSNAAQAGTFGFSIAAMEKSTSMGLTVLPGLAHGSAYRTNLGIMNPHEHTVTVRTRLYSAGGALTGDANVTLAPLTVQQPGIAQLFGDVQFAEGYVVLSSTDGSFFSYASVVDRKSNDPTLVLPSADRED